MLVYREGGGGGGREDAVKTVNSKRLFSTEDNSTNKVQRKLYK